MSKLITRALPLACALLLAACGGSQTSAPKAAATVNGHSISMATYQRYFTYKRVQSQDSAGGVDICGPKIWAGVCKKLKQTALNDLISQELIREFATRHHIGVSNQEYLTRWTVIYNQQYHGSMPVLRAVARRFGVTVTDLQNFVRENLLQQKVMYYVTRSMGDTVPAVKLSRITVFSQKQAEGVRKLVHDGLPFNALAARLNKDKNAMCSTTGCGDLGWLPYPFVPKDQPELKTARIGSIVGPFGGQTGFLLFLIEGRSSHYKLTTKQDFALRQQVFAGWLSTQVQHATVRRYIA